MKVPSKKSTAPKVAAKPKAAKAPTAPSKTPRLEWVAIAEAFATSKPGETDLPDYKKKAFPRGARLSATLTEDAETYWRIKDGVIAGQALPRNVRIIEKSQWALTPEASIAEHLDEPASAPQVPVVQAEPAPVPAPAPAPPLAPVVEKTTEPTVKVEPTVCVRGLRALAQALKPEFVVTDEGFEFHKKWGVFPSTRAVALHEQSQSPAAAALLDKLPWLPPGRYESAINTGGSDVYVLSFGWEGLLPLYKSKSTGLVLPIKSDLAGNAAFSGTDYNKIAEQAAERGVTEETWKFMQDEFEYVGLFDRDLLAADLEAMFKLLRGKLVIVITLNSRFGSAAWLLRQHANTNAVVRPVAESHGAEIIDIEELVHGEDDLAQPQDRGATFKPRVYKELASRVSQIITRHRNGDIAEMQE